MSNTIKEALCFNTSNELAGNPDKQPAPKSASDIAKEMLGPIDWISPTQGYCDCPGKARHANKGGSRDCAIYLDHIPTLHCVHQSCSTVIATTNSKLRDAILNSAPAEARKMTGEDKARKREREDRERIRIRASKALPQILEEFSWPYEQIISDSPTNVTGNVTEHWKMLLSKFPANDVVWIGNICASGKPEHAAYFKSVEEWLTYSIPPGPFTCPVSFKNNSYARSNNNVVARRFLVVESDVLKKNEVGAVFRWLNKACDLNLVAIIDTGGKSLHGWFEFDEDLLGDQKLVLPALQCDPKLFTVSQPVRIPSILRDGVQGKYQKLVYLANEVAHV